MKVLVNIITLFILFSCIKSPKLSECYSIKQEKKSGRIIQKSTIIQNEDFEITILSFCDSVEDLNGSLVMKNNYIAEQRIYIKSEDFKNEISIPMKTNCFDTIKTIENLEYKFPSSILQNVFLPKCKNNLDFFVLNFSGFNNGSKEEYYYFTTYGRFIGAIVYSGDNCDTLMNNELLRKYTRIELPVSFKIDL